MQYDKTMRPQRTRSKGCYKYLWTTAGELHTTRHQNLGYGPGKHGMGYMLIPEWANICIIPVLPSP